MSITKRVCYYSIGASFSLLIGIFLVLLLADSSFATSASTTTASVKVASACTLTTTGGGNYSATVPNGTVAEITGSTLSVSCNDAGGFALYAVGYSNVTVGNSNMTGANTNIATNTSGSSSYWAMKVNPVSGSTPTIENSFNNYHVIPDAHTKVASYNQSTSGSLAVTATYKVNISSSQAAGNYLGTVKYTLVHPANEVPPHEIACDPGKICYNANTNIVEGQMGKQSASNNTDVTLWASNFKKQNYGFAGWSDKYDYETNPDAHFYGPQQTITTPADTSTNGLSLYAIWIKSAGDMQDFINVVSVCNSLTTAPIDGTANLSSVTALTDNRDGNTYAIAELADNNCWMIENLRLDNSATLSSVNTNYPLLPLTNVYDLNTTSNHLSPTSSLAYNATTNPEGWCTTFSAACYDQSRIRTDNISLYTNNTASNYSASGDIYSYGTYYNWYSATAGHGKYDSYGSTYMTPGDICPSGWRLPTGDTWGEFKSLDVALGGTSYSTAQSNMYRSYPTNFVYSGTVSEATINDRNNFGYYHSPNSDSRGSSKIFNFNVSSIFPGTSGNSKHAGRSVRCILNAAS